MKKIFLLFLLSIYIVSCTPTIKTERVSLSESDEISLNLTDEWLMTDTEIAIKETIKQINSSKSFQRYLTELGRRPKIFIGELQNNTTEAYFPIEDMNDELLHEFSQSGNYILIDVDARQKILAEITYQNDGMVKDEDIKKIGKSSGADLIVFGNINMNPKTFMGKTTKDYSVNIRITDIESGEEVVRTRYKLSKYSKRNKIGW